MNIPFLDFKAQFEAEKAEILDAVQQVLTSGEYIGGEQITKFEKSFADICGVKYAVAVANCTDALIMAMRLFDIGQGDEVITAPNSWVSSASTIALIGATPVFVDVAEDRNIDPNLIEAKINKRTKAIIPVHLGGKSARMGPILELANKYKLQVFEDSAQAVGAEHQGQKCGSMGIVNCFSLHPTKNLGACGDAGVMTLNDTVLYEKLRIFGQHGMPNRETVNIWGYNSRLDSIQAAILNVRIKKINEINERRRANAALYIENLKGLVELPVEEVGDKDVYHLFVIQCDRRDQLRDYLSARGVTAAIHYPTPIHLQPAAGKLGYKKGDLPVVERQAERILSLPVSQMISAKEVNFISQQIREFYKS